MSTNLSIRRTEKRSLFHFLCKRKDKAKSYIQLFIDQARNNPSFVAIVSESQKITYEELDRKSDAVAAHLRGIGVTKGKLIGLCSSLNSNLVVCMLGILKSGGVYFPLDPSYPQNRFQYILQDGDPFLILAEKQFFHLFPNKKTFEIKESLFDIVPDARSNDISIEICPDDLAYVIYTSGSTGNPKGIMVAHKSLPHVASAHSSYYPPNANMLVSGGVCFDANLLVLFHALVNKNTVYTFDCNRYDSVNDLVSFIKNNSIEYMICVPSCYLKLLQTNCKLPCLKCISLTGENLPSSLPVLHAKLAPNAILYNEYGPSECAIGSTIAKIYDPRDEIIQPITVGKPLPNTQVYILDHNQQKKTNGQKGEICISGIGLAMGYLNNTSLTKKKFIFVKHSANKVTRLYRTGDYGRFLPNGELEFLGRMEQRVRVGKNWVNIGEIEHFISRCPVVKESAVVIQRNSQKKEALTVYVTMAKKISVKNLLDKYLQHYLSKLSIPLQVIQIDQFSFTPNGKIDRDALLLNHG